MRGLNAKANRQSQKDCRQTPVSSDQPQVQDEYKKRILTVVRQMMREGTFEEATMSQIAKQAGIGQGSLYRRYAHKGEICSELLLQSGEQLLAGLDQYLLPKANPDEDKLVASQLEDTILRVVDFIDENVGLLSVISSQSSGKNQLTQFENHFFQRLNKILLHLLSEALERREMERLDPVFTANALLAVLSPDVYLYQRKHHKTSKVDIASGILRIFIEGLAK